MRKITIILASQVLRVLFSIYHLNDTNFILLSCCHFLSYLFANSSYFLCSTYNKIYIWKASTSCLVLMLHQFSLQSRALQSTRDLFQCRVAHGSFVHALQTWVWYMTISFLCFAHWLLSHSMLHGCMPCIPGCIKMLSLCNLRVIHQTRDVLHKVKALQFNIYQAKSATNYQVHSIKSRVPT